MDSHRLVYFEPKCFNALIDIFWLLKCFGHVRTMRRCIICLFLFFSVGGGNTLDAEYILNLGMA